jgi:hypothetical protein
MWQTIKANWREIAVGSSLMAASILAAVLLADRVLSNFETVSRFQTLDAILTHARVEINQMQDEIRENRNWILRLEKSDECKVGNPARESLH